MKPRSLPPAVRLLATSALALAFASSPARADEPAAPPAPAAATPRAVVVHVPPLSWEDGEPVELAAQIDAPFAERLSVRWRPLGEPQWRDAAFERSSAGGWYATLPPARAPGLEYYLRGESAPPARDDAAAPAAPAAPAAELLHFEIGRAHV
jgi:hypothetical protein